MSTGWQKRRSAFNHDWLKNVYLTALDKWVNVLDGVVEDPAFEMKFLTSRFLEWALRREEAEYLLDRFEVEMSPRTLLSRPPLDRKGEWLGSVAHALWLHRSGVPSLVAAAKANLRTADALYRDIQCAAGTNEVSVADLRPLRDRFAAFARACAELALSISKLPTEIKVV